MSTVCRHSAELGSAILAALLILPGWTLWRIGAEKRGRR